MASDINLLPPELRDNDKRHQKDAAPEILYTNPDKITLPAKKEPEPVVMPNTDHESWWQKFRHQGHADRADHPTLSARHQPNLTPAPTIHQVMTPPTPAKVSSDQPVKTSQPHKTWSFKIFSDKKSRPVKQSQAPNKQAPAQFHQPINGNIHDGLEVDLASETVRFDRRVWRKKIIIALSLAGLWLILLVVAYWALISYQRSNQNLTSDVDAQLAQIQSELRSAGQTRQDISVLSQRLNLISDLLKGHQYWSRLFDFLEAQTLSGVFYDNLAIDPAGKISLGVVAKDYVTAAQQLAIFQAANTDIAEVLFTAANSQIQKTDTSQTTVVTFTVELIPQPSFFTKL